MCLSTANDTPRTKKSKVCCLQLEKRTSVYHNELLQPSRASETGSACVASWYACDIALRRQTPPHTMSTKTSTPVVLVEALTSTY